MTVHQLRPATTLAQHLDAMRKLKGATTSIQRAVITMKQLDGLAKSHIYPRPIVGGHFAEFIERWKKGEAQPTDETQKADLALWLVETTKHRNGVEENRRKLRTLCWMHDVFAASPEHDGYAQTVRVFIWDSYTLRLTPQPEDERTREAWVMEVVR